MDDVSPGNAPGNHAGDSDRGRPVIRARLGRDWQRGDGGGKPPQLAGGQRQRVALAPRPKVLLLDEPFGALDAGVRDELRTWLRRLHDEVHVTSLFVTHDQQEPFEVADQVIVMNHGKVEQMGAPEELYVWPLTPFVASFLGSVNVLRLPAATDALQLNQNELATAGANGDGASMSFYVRPHDLDLARESNGRPTWPGRGARIAPLGPLVRLAVELDDGMEVRVELTRDRYAALEPQVGSPYFLTAWESTVFPRGMAPE
jgi:sulfate transport system ATP-binding protein